MRATLASTPLLTIFTVALSGCFELPERLKDSGSDDTGAGGECPPDSIPGSLAGVTIIDFVVNGLNLAPTPSTLCVFAGGYGGRLGLSSGAEQGVVSVQSDELGAKGIPDDGVQVSVSWGDITWASTDFFTGSVVVSEGGGGGDSGLGDSGGGAFIGFNGEATTAENQQLVLNVSWGG